MLYRVFRQFREVINISDDNVSVLKLGFGPVLDIRKRFTADCSATLKIGLPKN